MQNVTLKEATTKDVAWLATMNAQLIEDEQYDAPLPIEELRRRMSEFIDGDFLVFLFTDDETSRMQLGYCIVDQSRTPLYLRHFFICREHRQRGFGRAALTKLIEHLGVKDLDVEVMAWNDAGRQFWRSLGFRHRYEGLRWSSTQ